MEKSTLLMSFIKIIWDGIENNGYLWYNILKGANYGGKYERKRVCE